MSIISDVSDLLFTQEVAESQLAMIEQMVEQKRTMNAQETPELTPGQRLARAMGSTKDSL